MPRRKAKPRHSPRNIYIRSELRDPIDVEKIAKALLAMAIREAQREQQATDTPKKK